MGSLCFSSATILRCESFTSLESQLLIIPTALELIFSTTLIITNWGNGWRHLLLTAEGWSYFALALLELLSHNIPAVRDSVSVFSIVDIVLGATSFLPIFFYISFVYLFTRGELTDTLPKRLQNAANVLLIIFIPAIVALNELSSFAGISRGTLNVGGRETVAIGFKTAADQQLWTFLTSLTLALLTAFEAINFCFAFYRLIRAFVDQRRIETTSTDQAHLLRGIGWIAGGFKLGAIETVIGFAQGGFGGALTRRIVRFLARAFLIIGIVKGVDHVDDFAEVTKEMSSGRTQFRRSRMGNLISNPRFSTFRQLSPTANDFYTAPRAGRSAGPTRRQSEGNLPAMPAMTEFAQVKREATMTRARTADTGVARPRQRVTVQYAGGAPTLHMRFSELEMPSPAIIAESIKSRPISSTWVSIARSSRYAPSSNPSFAYDAPPVPTAYPEFIYDRGTLPPQDDAPPAPVTYPEFIYDRGTLPRQSAWSAAPSQTETETQHQRMSEFSARSSGYPDSLNAVRELASQFPPLPRPAARYPTPIEERSEWHDYPESPQRSRVPYPTSYDSAYGGSVLAPRTPPRQNAYQHAGGAFPEQSPEPEPLRYAYGGMEYPESPEPVYRYNYDGVVSPEQVHVHPYTYASPVAVANNVTPSRHRNVRSETTVSNTPMTYLSPFAQDADSTLTPATESDPFEYDEGRLAPYSGKAAAYRYQYGQPVSQPMYMGDGPRSGGSFARADRSSAALLQMTQRAEVDWTPAEFTPSMFSPEPPASAKTSSTGRNTLKKKRRPPPKGATSGTAASVETFASSWLHGDMDSDAYTDDERPSLTGLVPVPVRVKSVGRVKAPRKETPAPVNARHGMARGSVYIQPITVPRSEFHSEVQIVQGGSSADSYRSEFDQRP